VIKGEATTLPANMMELFQRFVASISNKEKGKEVAAQPEEGMIHEKKKQDKEEILREVAESSAQGEARGNIMINAPYYYHCLTRGMRRRSALCRCFVTFVKAALMSKLPAMQESEESVCHDMWICR
jgi:hypothetical protein